MCIRDRRIRQTNRRHISLSFSALVNTYVSQEDDVYDKLIDVAHHHEAVIEGKRVAHQILDSDGKVNTVLLQIILLMKIEVRKHTFHVELGL